MKFKIEKNFIHLKEKEKSKREKEGEGGRKSVRERVKDTYDNHFRVTFVSQSKS